jgi:hypothetical protein
MAMAPVIPELRSPVVGDATGATFDDTFVWEDAWNLDLLVSDLETSDAGILWSYVTGEFDGTFGPFLSKYSLNGVDPQVDPSAAEAINPPAANRIDNQVVDSELNTDGNFRTVTIRDRELSPIGGPNSLAPGTGPGIVGSETVTLFASDGSSVGWATTIIFTENDAEDHFSGVKVEIIEPLDGSTADTSISPDMTGTDFVFTDFGGSSFPERQRCVHYRWRGRWRRGSKRSQHRLVGFPGRPLGDRGSLGVPDPSGNDRDVGGRHDPVDLDDLQLAEQRVRR